MTDDLAARFPSILWDERQWFAVLKADDGIFRDILDDMALFAEHRRRKASALSPKQAAYLAAASEGCEVVDIGRRFCVAPATVKATLGVTRSRLGARNTTHAVALALSAGLIPQLKRSA